MLGGGCGKEAEGWGSGMGPDHTTARDQMFIG